MKFTEAKRKINLEKNGLLQKIPWSKNFITKSEFFWLVDYDDEFSEKIIVPKNFVTDFGSIPRFLWGFFDKTRFVSYILHDFMYSKKYKDFEEEKIFKQFFQENSIFLWLIEEEIDKYVNKKLRKKADKILKEVLKVEWMWFFKRNLVYLWVRLFWKKFFRKS